MSLYLIRHGQTRGNLERRYTGCRTDEPLCPEGIQTLQKLRLPPVSRVVCSPMKRCLQSAGILFPGAAPETVPDFRECDFGAYEGRNFEELKDSAAYRAWVSSGGELPFPGGESRGAFAARCVRAFDALRLRETPGDCALVVHGGTIMAILEAYARPAGGYFDFQTGCGEGYVLEKDGRYRKLGPAFAAAADSRL